MRFLLSARVRDRKDALAGPFYRRLRGKLGFVCLAWSEADGEMLMGRLFLFQHWLGWRGDVFPKIETAQQYLRRYSFGEDGNLEAYFRPTYDALFENLTATSAFNADFTVERTGITEIKIPEPMVVAPGSPALPAAEPDRNHMIHVVAAQLFYFLRDIGHRHQHHDPNTDTVINLQHFDPDDPFEWKLQVLYSLYRKAIVYKRARAAGAFTSAQGVLAYAQTFRNVIEKDIKVDDRKRLPHFDSENVLISIGAMDQELRREEARREARSDLVRELILGAMAIIIAVVGVFQITEKRFTYVTPDPLLVLLAETLISRPLVLAGGVGATILVSIMLFGLLNVGSNSFVRWIIRVVQPYSVWISISMFVVLSAIIAVVIAGIMRWLSPVTTASTLLGSFVTIILLFAIPNAEGIPLVSSLIRVFRPYGRWTAVVILLALSVLIVVTIGVVLGWVRPLTWFGAWTLGG